MVLDTYQVDWYVVWFDSRKCLRILTATKLFLLAKIKNVFCRINGINFFVKSLALTTLWIGGQDMHPVSGSIPESAVKNTNSKNI